MRARLRRDIRRRSGGRCEVHLGHRRCPNRAAHVHHLVTKARGGRHLDAVGETYHLLHVCPSCHRACDGGEAYDGGLLIEGYVIWDKLTELPRYQGPDEYLTVVYGEESA